MTKSLLYVVDSKTDCHPEPVEGSRAEAFAHMLRQAQQDKPFLNLISFFRVPLFIPTVTDLYTSQVPLNAKKVKTITVLTFEF
jgi:hypothetical protein